VQWCQLVAFKSVQLQRHPGKLVYEPLRREGKEEREGKERGKEKRRKE